MTRLVLCLLETHMLARQTAQTSVGKKDEGEEGRGTKKNKTGAFFNIIYTRRVATVAFDEKRPTLYRANHFHPWRRRGSAVGWRGVSDSEHRCSCLHSNALCTAPYYKSNGWLLSNSAVSGHINTVRRRSRRCLISMAQFFFLSLWWFNSYTYYYALDYGWYS